MHKYFSTNQFISAIKSVRGNCDYHKVPYPTALSFVGTVKIHGTNTSVKRTVTGTAIEAQSRNNVITPDNDHLGFASFTVANSTLFEQLINNVINTVTIEDPDTKCVVIYGEYFGQGVTKKVAVSTLPKTFSVFNIAIMDIEPTITIDSAGNENPDFHPYWLTKPEIQTVFSMVDMDEFHKARIYNIFEFQTFEVTIDINRPELVQNKLVELTTAVENECPVGKYFGVSGVGEGIVWTCQERFKTISYDRLTFKVKGEKHSVSKVKTIVEVDLEKFNNVLALVDAIVTENRLEQGLEYLKEAKIDFAMEAIGPFLKWIAKDCLKEEKDRMDASGLAVKEVMPAINKKAKTWFLTKIQEEVFGKQ